MPEKVQVTSSSIEEYISQLNDLEKIAFKIAQEHLGTSFNIENSVGYVTWLKKRPIPGVV